jgi:hypothetical protein
MDVNTPVDNFERRDCQSRQRLARLGLGLSSGNRQNESQQTEAHAALAALSNPDRLLAGVLHVGGVCEFRFPPVFSYR